MAIIYYPDHIQKKSKHAVERDVQSTSLMSVEGRQDLDGNALAFTFGDGSNWRVKKILISFSDAVTARTYTISNLIGRGIVAGLNDVFYVKTNGVPAQPITLSAGYYPDGDTLATELKTQLDANTAFIGAGITPFTVSYDTGTGLFTISPDSGTIEYFDVNTTVPVRRNSTAGHVLGFTADTGQAASIVSDTAVPGLGSKVVILSGAGVTTQNIVSTDTFEMTIDDGIAIDIDAAALVATYKIVYEALDI